MATTIDDVHQLQIRNAKNGDFDLNLADETARNQIDDLSQDLEVQTARIDNILVQGTPTEGNAELIDIRVGADGTIYPTAGDAVRTQIEDLSEDLVKKSLLFNEIPQEEDSVSISISTSGESVIQVQDLVGTATFVSGKGIVLRNSGYLSWGNNHSAYILPVTGGHTYRFVPEDISTSAVQYLAVSTWFAPGFDFNHTTMYSDIPNTYPSTAGATINGNKYIFRPTEKITVPSDCAYLVIDVTDASSSAVGNWGVYDFTEYPIEVTDRSQLVENPSSDSYAITYNLTNAESSNSVISVPTGSTYVTTITPSTDYSLDEVKVTIGGVDYTPANRQITITDVASPITISATGTLNEGYVGKYEIKEELIPSDLLDGKLDTPTGLSSADSGKVLYTDGEGGLEIDDLPNKNYAIGMEWTDVWGMWKAGYYYDTDGTYTQATTETLWGALFTDKVSCTDYDNLIEAKPFEKWKYVNPRINKNSSYYIPNVIVFDENKAMIDAHYGALEVEFTIPSNGAYIAVNYYGDQSYQLQKMAIPQYDEFEIDNDVESYYRLFKRGNSPTLNTLSKGYICLGTDDLRRNETKALHEMYTNANAPYYIAAIPSNMKGVVLGGNYQTNLDYANLCVANGGEIMTHNGGPLTTITADEFDKKYNYFVKAKKELEYYGFKVRGIILAGGQGQITNDPRLNAWATRYYEYADLFGSEYPYRFSRRDFEFITEAEIDAIVEAVCVNHGYQVFYAHKLNETVQTRFDYLMSKLANYTSADYEFTTPSHLYDLLMG